MLKRLFLVMSSKSVRRQPEKLSHRWWKVWNEVRPGDQCWQSRVLVDQICQRHEWVVPDIAAWYRDELCSSVLQSYTVCAPGLKSIEGWRVRRWCGRSVDALGDLQWKCIHSSRRTRAVYLSVIGVKMRRQTTWCSMSEISSTVYKTNRTGPSTEPWGTPHTTWTADILVGLSRIVLPILLSF